MGDRGIGTFSRLRQLGNSTNLQCDTARYLSCGCCHTAFFSANSITFGYFLTIRIKTSHFQYLGCQLSFFDVLKPSLREPAKHFRQRLGGIQEGKFRTPLALSLLITLLASKGSGIHPSEMSPSE